MNKVPLKLQSIIPRMDGITRDVERLRTLVSLPFEQFGNQDNVDIAKVHLREALEGVFNIGAHVLSRIEGGRATEYKDIARKLGEYGIVKKQFADTTLFRMAGYRNRLTHFYAEISPKELYGILQNNLDDFNAFLSAIKQLLEHPEKFGLGVE